MLWFSSFIILSWRPLGDWWGSKTSSCQEALHSSPRLIQHADSSFLHLSRQQPFSLTKEEMESVCQQSEGTNICYCDCHHWLWYIGYSGADVTNLCREAAILDQYEKLLATFSTLLLARLDKKNQFLHCTWHLGVVYIHGMPSETYLTIITYSTHYPMY